MPRGTEFASFVAGFVAGEGCFTLSGRPSSFRFAVGLGPVDSQICDELQAFFGVAHVTRSPRRRPHYDDEVCFAVRALPDLVNVIVPFMDEHLLPSYKRNQYQAWRTTLLSYWEHQAKRVRGCTVEGCTAPRRARGLCRRHYYAAFRR